MSTASVAGMRAKAAQATGIYRDNLGLAYWAHLRRDPLDLLHARTGRNDPYRIYDRIRARGTLVKGRGGWMTTDHALVTSILRDRRLGMHAIEPPPPSESWPLSFLQLNPPDHTRLRRLVAPAFGPRQMIAYKARIEETVHRMLDEVQDREFDLVTEFAAPLPVAVISDLLGVPNDRAGDFARFGATIGGALDGLRSLRHVRELEEANRTLEELLSELFEQRRREPADDVVSAVVAAEAEEQIRPGEMVPLCVLLLLAGFETTVNMIGNGMQAFLAHPDQWRALGADPSLAEQATEEVLRFDPPVQRMTRVALEDLELAGQHIRKGENVVSLIGGANRDPAVFSDPAVFDIKRTDANHHLSFSGGIHFCPGHALARLEGQIAFGALASRMPTLHRRGRVQRRVATTIRGPIRFPVGS